MELYHSTSPVMPHQVVVLNLRVFFVALDFCLIVCVLSVLQAISAVPKGRATRAMTSLKQAIQKKLSSLRI